jgi:hypothetical protein
MSGLAKTGDIDTLLRHTRSDEGHGKDARALRVTFGTRRPAAQSALRGAALHANTRFHGKDDHHRWLVVGSLRRP